MHPKTVLITGTNRGIGLELIKAFVKLDPAPEKLIATCRDPDAATELQDVAKSNKNIHIVKLDVLTDVPDESKLSAFVSQVEDILQGAGLNLLINNAGKLVREPLDVPTLTEVFTVNAFASLLICKAFIPLLKKAASDGSGDTSLSLSRAGVINMSSKVGSIADNGKGGNTLYRGSKIALNMFNKNLSIEYGGDGILFVLLHPGWVQTGMGGPNALISTEQCVQGLMEELQDIAKSNKNLHIVKLDVLTDVPDENKLSAFVSQVEDILQGMGLNLLINNAGVLLSEPLDVPTLTQVFTVNAFAPLLICKALIPLLKKAASDGSGDTSLNLSRAGVINISAKTASIADNGMGGLYLSRGSKIALNMFTKNLSIEYGGDGILFVLLHPGWVKTELGGPGALISTEQCVQGMMQVMGRCTEKDQARFYDYKGIEIPW